MLAMILAAAIGSAPEQLVLLNQRGACAPHQVQAVFFGTEGVLPLCAERHGSRFDLFYNGTFVVSAPASGFTHTTSLPAHALAKE